MNFKQMIFGKAINPFQPNLFRNIALVSFFAWIGLGADGLSSSCYGPEEAFRALGHHPDLALFVAIATVLTVFIIALGYNQVVELFPSGGGGYKVVTELLGKRVGLISGSALVVDYVLTIAISTASGIDAFFSLLPATWLHAKLLVEALCIVVLVLLNLRGVKESIRVLLPIFLGFLTTHLLLIFYGVFSHKLGLPVVAASAVHDTRALASSVGLFSVLAFLLHAYSLGSGTYTGLEAVSNNVNCLAEPRVRTGKVTMMYMAISLSVMAGGITLLYLLWPAHPVPGETLNAVVFREILGFSPAAHMGLIAVLCFEAGILLVAANTGFLAGPQVLANMASDNWLPRRFRLLSARLVTKNGIILFGVAALTILVIGDGRVSWLIVLYSINVFITFSLTLLGLCVYWAQHRHRASPMWLARLAFSALGFLVTGGILITTLLVKFKEGGWITLLITSCVIFLFSMIHRYYERFNKTLRSYNRLLAPQLKTVGYVRPTLDPKRNTAILFVNEQRSVGMHSLLWIHRTFSGHFKNFVFISVGQVDTQSFRGRRALVGMRRKVENTLRYFVTYCHQQGWGATSYVDYGAEILDQLIALAEQASHDFPKHLFFASQLIFSEDTWFSRLLHNETPVSLQRRLHGLNEQLVILPMRFDDRRVDSDAAY